MALRDICHMLYREIARSRDSYVKTLALIGAWYTATKCIRLICGTGNLLRAYFIPLLVRRTDLVKQYGSWAVVTGATDGIGKAYSEELACRGVNVILITRNREKLERISQAITETYEVETDFIVADFSKGREIYPAIKKALDNVEIGILVNNVGVCHDYPEYFTLVPEEKVWDIININVAAATIMVHIVLPGMVERKKGAIVNISSAACYRPIPLMAEYCASKAYMDLFSRTLHYEYASRGIFIQSLTPFYIATNMTAFIGRLHKSPWLVPSAAVFCRHAVSTLGVSTRTEGYWIHYLQFITLQCLPEWLLSNAIYILNQGFRKAATA